MENRAGLFPVSHIDFMFLLYLTEGYQVPIYELTSILKGNEAQLIGLEKEAKSKNAVLSSSLNPQNGVVEVQSNICMKIIDANGKVPLSRMAGILGNMEMCLLDWKGREVAGWIHSFPLWRTYISSQQVEREVCLLVLMEILFGNILQNNRECTLLLQNIK